ncbi:MAG: hypothetical protein P1U36_04610 [Legionellaceae bacterium]|nr:hypothetical protein [Legionellaceae bacterium]
MLIQRLNIYSWSLAILYFIVAIVLETHSPAPSMQGIYSSFPLIAILILWSEKSSKVINIDDTNITKKEAFSRDLFLITLGFTLAFMLPLAFKYNNSDVQGWWALGIVIGTIIGFFYACVFSLISLILEHHKKQTIFFIYFIFVIIIIESFVPQSIIPRYISLFHGLRIEFFHFFISASVLIYFFFCLLRKSLKK